MLMMKVRQMRAERRRVPCPIHQFVRPDDAQDPWSCRTCGTVKGEVPRLYEAVLYPVANDRVLYLNPAMVLLIEADVVDTHTLDSEPDAFVVWMVNGQRFEGCRGSAGVATSAWGLLQGRA